LINASHFLQDHSCKFTTEGDSGVAHGYEAYKKHDEKALKKAVATRGPISVAFSAVNSFHHYSEGEL
jgi:hypothetical protein